MHEKVSASTLLPEGYMPVDGMGPSMTIYDK
jgi:hypothetical protein